MLQSSKPILPANIWLSIDSFLHFDCAGYLADARYALRARLGTCHDTCLWLACGWLFANRAVQSARCDMANTPARLSASKPAKLVLNPQGGANTEEAAAVDTDAIEVDRAVVIDERGAVCTAARRPQPPHSCTVNFYTHI